MASVEKKKVVILGSGYAAIALCDELSKKKIPNVDIVIVSKTNYFYHNIASPRILVEKETIDLICIPLDKKCQEINASFVHGKAVEIKQNELIYSPIENNAESNLTVNLAFDYLILAFGSSNTYPFYASNNEKNAQVSALNKTHDQMKNAKKILIVGGGAVGCEVAGELATDCPDKKITLVTNSERLVRNMDPSFSIKALDILRKKNVEIIFNDTCDLTEKENFKENKVTTRNGKEIEFDAYYICIGIKPNTEAMQKSLSDSLDQKGFVKVNKHLQLLKLPNIFAIGDCCALNDPKMALVAGNHASLVAYNLNELLNGRNTLKEYKEQTSSIMLMTLGRDNGVFRYGCILTTGFMPRIAKAKDFFIPRFRKQLGY